MSSKSSKLFLLFSARASSTRVPHKLTRPLANGDCLFDIYLRRLKRLQDNDAFCGTGIALCPSDDALMVRAHAAGVNVIERSEASIEKGAPLNVIFECLKDVDAEWCMWVNACQPFLKDSTILDAAVPRETTATLCKRMQLYPWSCGSRSDTSPKHMLIANSFHIYNIEHLMMNGTYWPKTPHAHTIQDEKEILDADSELAFDILSALYNSF